MPIYEYLCLDCGKTSEILMVGSDELPQCNSCKSYRLKKLLSAHSSMSGALRNGMPGLGDTACCGSSPGDAGCAGPGSCCGKNLGQA
jgi:putative FmdB family regulatory protein